MQMPFAGFTNVVIADSWQVFYTNTPNYIRDGTPFRKINVYLSKGPQVQILNCLEGAPRQISCSAFVHVYFPQSIVKNTILMIIPYWNLVSKVRVYRKAILSNWYLVPLAVQSSMDVKCIVYSTTWFHLDLMFWNYAWKEETTNIRKSI